MDEQEYLEQKFDEDVSLKPGVPFKVSASSSTDCPSSIATVILVVC